MLNPMVMITITSKRELNKIPNMMVDFLMGANVMGINALL
jgi:hypothetical protein